MTGRGGEGARDADGHRTVLRSIRDVRSSVPSQSVTSSIIDLPDRRLSTTQSRRGSAVDATQDRRLSVTLPPSRKGSVDLPDPRFVMRVPWPLPRPLCLRDSSFLASGGAGGGNNFVQGKFRKGEISPPL